MFSTMMATTTGLSILAPAHQCSPRETNALYAELFGLRRSASSAEEQPRQRKTSLLSKLLAAAAGTTISK
ncbi:hypothetical protein EXIGLDRAFT_720288 [Exidia glandulosa HHB12029]|uniref:Uncharacterized protein n=1 Tax=Exidia glandulosa HHB12029 TaxID=1314781 RepID=A0A165GH78_EXIGL|nr:hypothetical protein EXIGLDRAFT_720288 [Exidia glandulosa HHB12029]